MYLPQPDPDQELIVLPYDERLEMMLGQTGARGQAARDALIGIMPGAGSWEQDEAQANRMIATFADRNSRMDKTPGPEAQQR